MPVTAEHMTPSRIEIDAAQSEISELAAYLQEHLGQRVAAYLSGLKDPKMVGKWAKGRVQPRDAASLRLRNGYQATRLIAEAFGDETAKAWLFGSNSQLGGEAPAFVLRNARLPEDVTPIVRAASGFVESGHGAARRERASEQAWEARRREAHHLAGLLAEEIHLYQRDPSHARARDVAQEINKALSDNPKPRAERLLELARDEIEDRLGKVVEDARSGLAERTGA